MRPELSSRSSDSTGVFPGRLCDYPFQPLSVLFLSAGRIVETAVGREKDTVQAAANRKHRRKDNAAAVTRSVLSSSKTFQDVTNRDSQLQINKGKQRLSGVTSRVSVEK